VTPSEGASQVAEKSSAGSVSLVAVSLARPPGERVIRRVALTGGIATGKSHVRATFERLGVPTIDADALARAALAPGTVGLAAVVARFGREVLDATGALDRRRLASIVFADAAARHGLEAIVHPGVRLAIDRWFAVLPPDAWGIADVPLLYESGRASHFDAVIATTCPRAVQLARLSAREGMTAEDAERRMAAQLPLEEKVRRADYVIDTGGTFEETDRQVRETLGRLTRQRQGSHPSQP
jgi:dephospho-CoA kinase